MLSFFSQKSWARTCSIDGAGFFEDWGVPGGRSRVGLRAIDRATTAQQGKIFFKSLKNRKFTNMNRPQSVTILAILQLLSAIFSLFDGLVILFFAGLFGGIGAAIGGAKVGTVIGGRSRFSRRLVSIFPGAIASQSPITSEMRSLFSHHKCDRIQWAFHHRSSPHKKAI
jgi:hypothetical protein